MKTIDQSTDLAEADAQVVFDHFAIGVPLEPELAMRVRERGRKIRDEAFRKHSLLDIGVPAIRELRGELPNS